MMLDSLLDNTRTGPILNLYASATTATNTTLVDAATGAAVAVPAGKRLVIAGGCMSVSGNGSTVVLEDEDGNALGPTLQTPNAASVGTLNIPPLRVPTAAKTARITTATSGAVTAAIHVVAYLEDA